MTKSPLVVVNFALYSAGAFSFAFDGSRRAGWTVDASGPEAFGAGAGAGVAHGGDELAPGVVVVAAAADAVAGWGSGSRLEQAHRATGRTQRSSGAFMAPHPYHYSPSQSIAAAAPSWAPISAEITTPNH